MAQKPLETFTDALGAFRTAMSLTMNTEYKFIGCLTIGGIVLFFLIFPLRPFVIISAGERGVIVQWGKVQKAILGEGIHPIFPIATQVQKMNVRIQKIEIEESVGTKDLQSLNAKIALNYHLNPDKVDDLYQTIGDNDTISEIVIVPAIQEAVKASTPKRNSDETLRQRELLKEEIDNKIVERLEKYGILVDGVSLINLSFSDEYKASIEEKKIAEQKAEAAKYEKIATIERAKGEAEAQKILKQSLTPQLLQQQAINKWDGRLPQVMGGNGMLPMINIQPSSLSDKNP